MATRVFTFASHLLSLLCFRQARQDILAQDLAEAIDSQVELAEQLRCYREENEKLLTEKQGVCVCVFLCHHGSGSVMQMQLDIHDGKCRFDYPTTTHHYDVQKPLARGKFLMKAIS